MASEGHGWLDKALTRLSLRRWAAAAGRASDTDLPRLRRLRTQARRLRVHLDRLIHVADSRLALPLIGNQAFPRPHDADWAWRPELWSGALPVPGLHSVQSKARLGQEVSLFHDCPHAELALRQLRNLREADLAPFGLRLDVLAFAGTYLSIAVDLPQDMVRGLTRRHLVRIDTIVELEKPLEIFARLNIRHGPNTEQIVRELPLGADDIRVEFDLAYTRLNEKRIERAWLDLIFESPEMNQVILRDLTFSRRKRAEL